MVRFKSIKWRGNYLSILEQLMILMEEYIFMDIFDQSLRIENSNFITNGGRDYFIAKFDLNLKLSG